MSGGGYLLFVVHLCCSTNIHTGWESVRLCGSNRMNFTSSQNATLNESTWNLINKLIFLYLNMWLLSGIQLLKEIFPADQCIKSESCGPDFSTCKLLWLELYLKLCALSFFQNVDRVLLGIVRAIGDVRGGGRASGPQVLAVARRRTRISQTVRETWVHWDATWRHCNYQMQSPCNRRQNGGNAADHLLCE